MHGITGVGVDISTASVALARERAADLGVDVTFQHGDATTFVADEPADVASCIGATWNGDGVAGTIEILERSLKPGGMLLIGEPYWRLDPPDEETARNSHAKRQSEFRALPDLVGQFGALGWDVVEMMLSNQEDWDRYAASHWLSIRRWLDANPGDPMVPQMRAELDTERSTHSGSRWSRSPRARSASSRPGCCRASGGPPPSCSARCWRRPTRSRSSRTATRSGCPSGSPRS